MRSKINKIFLILLLLFTAFLFACDNKKQQDNKENNEVVNPEDNPTEHQCNHVCPECGKCTDENCTDPKCSEKCPGHEVIEEHVCQHVCSECGKCTDPDCADPKCSDKCSGHENYNDEGLEEFVNEFVKNFPMEVTGNLLFENEVDGINIFYVSDNVDVVDNSGNVTFPETGTFVTITITFAGKNSSGNYIVETYDLIVFVPAKSNEYPEIHECSHICPICGKCTDLNCQDPVCNDKCLGHADIPEEHTCHHICPICGKCTDASCQDSKCSDKCLGHTQGEGINEQILDDIGRELSDVFGSSPIKDDINLPLVTSYGYAVRWETSDASIISATGEVGKDINNKTVTLTYYIIYEENEYGPYSIIIIVNNYVNAGGNTNAYYSSISSSLTGSSLKSALRTLITNTHKRKTTYEDLKSLTAKTDADPNKSGNIILFYSRKSVSAKWDGGTTWNREHVWPQSKSWFTTSGAGADIHHLRPANPSINSSRGNKAYGTATNSSYFCPDDCVKGDVARIVFYLLVRYPESDSYSITKVAYSMNMLLEWNELDPVDQLEINRNNAAYDIQGNRNPFIDYPDYADMIWGSQKVSSTNVIGEFIELNVVLISELKKDYMEI